MKKIIISVFAACFAAFPLWAQTNDELTIVGCGDIVMGVNYPANNQYLPEKDGTLLFSQVTDFLSNADVTFGNLEGVLLDKGGTPKRCGNPNSCYVFRMPEHYVQNLVNAGFDVMSVANNHAHDFGEEGIKSTCRVLKDAGINFAGKQNLCETTVFERNGVKYGFCAFAPNSGTVNLKDYATARKLLSDLRKRCDIMIISVHAGSEGAKYARMTKKREYYLGEDRGNVYEFAHLCVDMGADIVFGHGPHVVRAVELYNNKFIAYSMGNFCTPFRVSKSGQNGYAPMIKVVIDRSGNFLRGEIKSAIQLGSNGPELDPQNRASREIKRLTQLDFPNVSLNITDDGIITRK